jgi:site-specific DNA-cytosine methylase
MRRSMADKNKKFTLPEELKGKRFRIRKLTPRETGRLMDLSEEEIDTMFAAGLSNSSLYRLHGNSIVVSVMYHIFRKLFIEKGKDVKKGEVQQLTLF